MLSNTNPNKRGNRMPTIAEIIGEETCDPVDFEQGQKVRVRREDTESHLFSLRDREFTVRRIEEAPCTCDSVTEDWHADTCNRTAVGHHQWVFIEVDGKEIEFSGAYLEHVE